MGNAADVSPGRSPVKIGILTEVEGLNFDEAFLPAPIFIEEDLKIRSLHLNDLIASKKAAGRFKDLDDIQQLAKE